MNPWLARRNVYFRFTVTTGKVVTGHFQADGVLKKVAKTDGGLILSGLESSLYAWFSCEFKIGVKKIWSATIDVRPVKGIGSLESWVVFFEVESVDSNGDCKINVESTTLGMITKSKFIK